MKTFKQIIELTENLAYGTNKDGSETFIISKREKGNYAKAQGYKTISMVAVDTKTGKLIKDYGSHIDISGAKIFAKNKGYGNIKNSPPAGLSKKAHTTAKEVAKKHTKMSEEFIVIEESLSKYIVRQNPSDKLWYALGHVGSNQWMPVSDGYKSKAQAQKWAKSQDKVDKAARQDVGGL